MDFFAITIDTDWAPDFAIDHVREKLVASKVKSTWFITHDSPAIKRLFDHEELFEIGIHPNFLPGSSHGESETLILEHMLALVPNAKVVRTHSLVQSTPLLYKMAADFHLRVDVSLFLPDTPSLRPHALYLYDEKLIRVPYFWEDDVEAYTPNRCWHINSKRYQVAGLKIFNFHPLYAYLNCHDMEGYAQLKRMSHLPKLDSGSCASFVNSGKGTDTLLDELIKHIKQHQQESFTISEIAALWDKDNSMALKL